MKAKGQHLTFSSLYVCAFFDICMCICLSPFVISYCPSKVKSHFEVIVF